MAAIEFRILTKLLKEGSLHEAVSHGIDEDQFKDPEARQIWRYLRQHWFNRNTYKTLPSISRVQGKWPSFQLTADPAEDAELKALLDELKMSSFESDARGLATYFQEMVDTMESPDAIREMHKHLATLIHQLNHTERLGVTEVVDAALEHYEAAQQGTVYGIPWPWDCLTNDTLGKRPGDFIVFYARMKQMKTWVMLFCAVYDYLVNNARVIIWSREMNKEKMSLRIASLIAKVDYQLFKKGKLPPKMQAKAYRVLKELKENEYLLKVNYDQRKEDARLGQKQLLLLCGRQAPVELEAVKGIVDEFCPDILYLDSFYHLHSVQRKQATQRWQRIAELAEDVKSMAEDLEIPIVAVHQANRLGEKTHGNTMADMSDSDVIAREADLIIRVIKRRGRELYEDDYEVEMEREKKEALVRQSAKPSIRKPGIRLPRKVEEEAAKQEAEQQHKEDESPRLGAELALVLPGNREGILDAFTIQAVPGYNFEFISSDYTVSEIESWVKEDEADKPAKAASKSTPQKPKFGPESFKNYRGKA